MLEKHKPFGVLLRDTRKQQGVTLAALAKHLGISPPYLSDIEHGKRKPLNSDRLKKAATILKIPLDDLVLSAKLSSGGFNLPVSSDRANKVATRLVQVWDSLTPKELQYLETFLKM